MNLDTFSYLGTKVMDIKHCYLLGNKIGPTTPHYNNVAVGNKIPENKTLVSS